MILLMFVGVLGNVLCVCFFWEMIPSIVRFGRALFSRTYMVKSLRVYSHNNGRECIHVTMRLGNKILALAVLPSQQVRDLKITAAKHFLAVKTDWARTKIVIRFRGKDLRCDEMTLIEAGISSGCEVLCSLNIRGGTGLTFHSIPTQNRPLLRPLLAAIRFDFDAWIQEERPRYKRRFEGDLAEGKEVAWDGFSGSFQYYFRTKEINPCKKYERLYSTQRHTIAVSYVWSATGLNRMAGR